jgi:Uma2 family endonuclease
MIKTPWRQPPLTKEQENDLFMLLLEDDTEDAPWMVMGDLQFWSASSFAHSLRSYAHEQGLDWYVASMLPIEYKWPNAARKKVLSPDTFVAFVEERTRTSFDVEVGGSFPPFVLEVVSPSSITRDQQEKRLAYELLGAREYALFTPREGAASMLEGYRRGATGQFEPWQPDEQGRLWSEVLGLYLVARGTLLQAQTAEGRLLLTPEQSGAALRVAEEARRREEEARRRAEEEAERLRCELERYRSQGTA